MVLPITKKPVELVRFSKTNKFGSVGYTYELYKQAYTQKMPIDRPLPYAFREVRVIEHINPDNLWTCTPRADDGLLNRLRTQAYAKSYDRFVKLVLQTDRAEVGMNLATAHMTRKLLGGFLADLTHFQKIGQIAEAHHQFTRMLRKAVHDKPRKRAYWRAKAAKELGVAPTSQKEVDAVLLRIGLRRGARNFSAEYLAFHYGWAPLYGDLWNLLGQLSKGYSTKEVPVKSSARVKDKSVRDFSTKTAKFKIEGPMSMRCIIAAQARVSSELSFVLNRTGLVNPATIAWDLVPFSFCLDWIGNFSQQLAAPTDFVGVELRNCSLTYYSDWQLWDTYFPKVTNVTQQARVMVTHGVALNRDIVNQPPVPKFMLKIPFGESWRRAFAQVSLLTLFGVGRKTTR